MTDIQPTTPPEPPRLDYSPPPPLGVRWRRWLTPVSAVVILAYAGWQLGPALARRVGLLYWQRQCLAYAAPADHVACVEVAPGTPGAAPGMTAGGQDPACLVRLTGMFALPPGPPSGGAVVFLHERTTPGGLRRLVVLRRLAPPARFAVYGRPVTWFAELGTPFGWRGGGAVPNGGPVLSEVIPSEAGGGPPRTTPLRVFAGRPDPADPSHFTIDYEMNGGRHTMDGWLRDPPPGDAVPYVELRPR